MNGRIYDPRLGRFLSPDPYVQAPDYSQSFNRYSYVWNNPMKYVDPDGELVWMVPVLVGAIIGGYSGYKIGKAKGAEGWSMAGYIFGGAVIGRVAGYTGFSLFSSGMAAATAAGMGGISAGFNIGILSGFASGFITGGGMAALGGGRFSGVLSGAMMGAWMGGVAGGFTGAIAGGFHNMKNGLNFWGNKLSKFAGNDLAYGYLVGGDGTITRMPGIQGDLGGADTHFFWTGNWDATRTAFWGERLPIIVDGLNTINAFRFWQSATSTISSFIVPATGLTGYFLEPKGPSTTERERNRRVPAASYLLTPNTGQYPDDFKIYNSLVPKDRGITIHSGNIPAHTKGCLLPGISWSANKVSSSKDMRDLLRLYINQNGYSNIRFNIINNF
jgi:hypothetical protein